jgi:hypothetical protein
MNVSGNFLPWTNMPNNDCGLFSFKHHRSNRLAIRWAGKLEIANILAAIDIVTTSISYVYGLFYTPGAKGLRGEDVGDTSDNEALLLALLQPLRWLSLIPSWFHPIVVAVFVVSILTHGGQLLEQLR